MRRQLKDIEADNEATKKWESEFSKCKVYTDSPKAMWPWTRKSHMQSTSPMPFSLAVLFSSYNNPIRSILVDHAALLWTFVKEKERRVNIIITELDILYKNLD